MSNRLIHEKSPYLLQHAHNPVDWYPWAEEAFASARSREVPIFLSIGYSTCHWCHVMERESFENAAVAQFLNAHFVAIKVDREERPDVDDVYMAALQATSGGGGWPMSVFLTPDLKPFYAGTYFPPTPAHGRPSFKQLLGRISELWATDRVALLESSQSLADALVDARSSDVQSGLNQNAIDRCFDYFTQSFDRAEGGFGGAPKFPRPVQFDFLFLHTYQSGSTGAANMAAHTLRKMALGGLHDHVGGGFHRYSVDRVWLVPHFEKMLYDQAQLTHSYLDAWQVTGDALFFHAAKSICDYVLRDMTSPGGGFFSAEDADSEGEEGTFYVWTTAEIEDVLGEHAALFNRHFGVTPQGNFEHGKNILHIAEPLEVLAREFGISQDAATASITHSLERMALSRGARIRPHLDDKILTSWNGLMIGALARAANCLSEPEYAEASRTAADFIWNNLRPDGRLLHRWRDGDAAIPAMLDDYSFLIRGLLDLYEASYEERWLERAIELQTKQDATLWDSVRNGYFLSEARPDLIVRRKSGYDGAEPSGNSVSCQNLIRLAVLTENREYRDRAELIVTAFAEILNHHPYAMPELMAGAMRLQSVGKQIVFSGPGKEVAQLKAAIRDIYLPETVTMHSSTTKGEFARSLRTNQEHPIAYVCKEYVCERPVQTPTELRALVSSKATGLPDA
jgi:uncharacterized protein YyaL (SSP411 family)